MALYLVWRGNTCGAYTLGILLGVGTISPNGTKGI